VKGKVIKFTNKEVKEYHLEDKFGAGLQSG